MINIGFLDVGGYSSKVRYILLHVLLDFRCNRASRPTSCTILSFERSDIPWFLPLLGYGIIHLKSLLYVFEVCFKFFQVHVSFGEP